MLQQIAKYGGMKLSIVFCRLHLFVAVVVNADIEVRSLSLPFNLNSVRSEDIFDSQWKVILWQKEASASHRSIYVYV